jgi:cysteinyl-tRNA synthetase
MNFTWPAVEGSQQALVRAWKIFADLKGGGTVDQVYRGRFHAALYDDFDTPKAIALLWELLKDTTVPAGVKRATILDFDRVLGFGFADKSRGDPHKVMVSEEVPEEVRALLAEREVARKSKDFAKADALRDRIQELGFTVEDGPKGPLVSRAPVVP